jgi:hypothetical protein
VAKIRPGLQTKGSAARLQQFFFHLGIQFKEKYLCSPAGNPLVCISAQFLNLGLLSYDSFQKPLALRSENGSNLKNYEGLQTCGFTAALRRIFFPSANCK